MKKILFILIAVLLMPFMVHAEDAYFSADETLSETKEISHNYFTAGATVKNNLNVHGILFSAANDLTDKSNSEYAFLAGNKITFEGRVEKDLFVAGNTIDVKDSIVERDIYAAGSFLTISGTTFENGFIGGQSIDLSDVSFKNLSVSADNIKISKDTTITGILKINNNAKVTGLENRSDIKVEYYENPKANVDFSFFNSVTAFIISLAVLIVTAILVNLICKNIYKNKTLEKYSFKDMAKSIGVGFLILICVPIIALILLFTVIGIPISIMGLIAYIIAIYLGTSFSGTYLTSILTKSIFKKDINIYLNIIIGCILVKLIGLIPVVGGIIKFLLILYGLGIIFYLYKNYRMSK